MRQQEGINDDNEHDDQLDRGNHQKGYSCEERDDDQKVKADTSGCFSIAVT